ncbi:MAG: histidine kinase [Bryobacteraceae bacterium]
MPGWNQPLLINILGHAAGALVFAIFLALLYSGRGWSGSRGRYLPGLAAALSLLWNLGSLAMLAVPGLPATVQGVLVACSFSTLSVLPAVLLHISLGGRNRGLAIVGYVLGAAASLMHFVEIGGNAAAWHQAALLVTTIGFLSLTALAVASAAYSRRPGGIRILAAMCLALFAMSFVHFGAGHASQAWASELVVHHAGIPLALFLLLQDYRFVLLDAFIRFLANALLAGILTLLVISIAFRLLPVERIADPLHEAALLIGVGLILACFAWLRNRVQALLTGAVFRQSGVAGLVRRIQNCPPFTEEEAFLEWSAAAMAMAVHTPQHSIVGGAEIANAEDLHAPAPASAIADSASLSRWDWAETVVPVRLGSGSSKLILLGRRDGGRRYLSGDFDMLARAAMEVSEKVESLRRREMERLVSQGELRALQSQINPHFLFNALNAVYGTIPREAERARRMVLNLAEIFRYFLQSEKTFVPLAQELQIVRAYLEVEQSRLGDRLKVEIDVDEALREIRIPALSVEPLVENAVRHGIAPSMEPGYVRIRGQIEGGQMRILVENSSHGDAAGNPGNGVGLDNVRRRLEICYGRAAGLRLVFNPGATVAELSIPAAAHVRIVS